MLNLVYVLLVMALVIALFGIANTLALSVFERTREFGLLRAVGMSRAQVRSSVRWESVLIALLGTVLGTAIGLGFGWALVQALKDKGIGTLSIPTTQLGYVDRARRVRGGARRGACPPAGPSRLDVLDSDQGRHRLTEPIAVPCTQLAWLVRSSTAPATPVRHLRRRFSSSRSRMISRRCCTSR